MNIGSQWEGGREGERAEDGLSSSCSSLGEVKKEVKEREEGRGGSERGRKEDG